MTNEIEGVNSSRREIKEILSDKEENSTHKRFYGLDVFLEIFNS